MNDVEHLVVERLKDGAGEVCAELLECGHLLTHVRELKPGLQVRRCPHCRKARRRTPVRASIARLRAQGAEVG
ncbi:MAG: hypothetical protein KA310_03280 [Pseudomonadales bacterium]|nr:hypothetical protein [Pseudomonadales bacterium]